MYEAECRLKSRDVNRYRRLRTSRFMEMVQECSVAHTLALGFGPEKTLERGLLWVVIQQHFRFYRMPVYDEQVRMSTWPGQMSHVLFPRFYRLTAADTGEMLADGSAYWVLVNAGTRSAVFPSQAGIRIEAEAGGPQPDLPHVMKQEEPDEEETFAVPFSWCDLNGHMNNARYFDLLENMYPPSADWEIQTADAEYRGEALFGNRYHLRKKYRPAAGGGSDAGIDSRRIALADENDLTMCRIQLTGVCGHAAGPSRKKNGGM